MVIAHTVTIIIIATIIMTMATTDIVTIAREPDTTIAATTMTTAPLLDIHLDTTGIGAVIPTAIIITATDKIVDQSLPDSSLANSTYCLG